MKKVIEILLIIILIMPTLGGYQANIEAEELSKFNSEHQIGYALNLGIGRQNMAIRMSHGGNVNINVNNNNRPLLRHVAAIRNGTEHAIRVEFIDYIDRFGHPLFHK